MLNGVERITAVMPADAAGFESDEAFGVYLAEEAKAIRRRLIRWVGAEAYNDATLGAPTDPDRADAVKDAEYFLLLAALTLKINMDASSGAIASDFKTPSGLSVSMDISTTEGRMELVDYLTQKADSMIEDWKVS